MLRQLHLLGLLVTLILCGLPAASSSLILDMTTSATCIDNGVIEDQTGGSASASCQHMVNQGGLFPRVMTMSGMVNAIGGFRSVGVDGTLDIDQTARLPITSTIQLSASSQMHDDLMFFATDAMGNPVPAGVFTMNAVATGFMNLFGTGSYLGSDATLDVLIAIGGTSYASQQFLLDVGTPVQGISVPISAVIPWTYGAVLPVTMQATLSMTGQLTDDGFVDMMIDFGNSLDWSGISGVTDGSGVPVASFTALSPDGSDWAAPLPEPAGLAAIAVLLVAARAVRRRG